MKTIGALAVSLIMLSTAAQANCPPPMQILFSCTLEDSDARVEFCHHILQEQTANSSSTPGDLHSYSLARGTERAELYFEPTRSAFKLIPANDIDRKIYGRDVTSFLTVGYENKDYVYAALLAVDDDMYSGYSGAELRVFRNMNDFDNAERGTDTARYFCKTNSVIAHHDEFRP